MNKKVVLSVLSTAVVASMAASAFAAPKDGLYIGGSVNKYYSTDVLLNMSATAKAAYANEVKSITDFNNLVFVDFAGKGASIQEILDEGLTKAKSEALVKEDFAASYAVATVNGTTDGSYDARAAVEPGPVGDLTVESVSAINANQVELKFSKALDSTDGENEARFTINGKALAGADVATLSEDGKTVVITFDTTGAGVLANGAGAGQIEVAVDGFLNNNAAYTVEVAASLIDADGKTLGTASSKPLYFTDSVKPQVQEVKALENGDLRVKFSERYATSGDEAVIINGQNVSLVGAGMTDDTYNGYLTIPRANIVAATTLEAGKSYSIVVSKFDDFAGNTMNLYSGTFTYSIVSDAPSVVSVTAKDEKTLVVTMSEAVVGLDNNTLDVFKGVTDLNIGAGDITNPKGDNKTFEVALPVAPNTLYDSSKNETSVNLTVKANGYRDTTGNIGAATEKAVTVTKDTVKPTVSKSAFTFTTGAGNDTLVLTLSENVGARTAAQLAAGLTIIGSDGVLYPVAATDIPADELTGGTDKQFTIVTDLAAGLNLQPGDYTLRVAANTFTDTSLNNGNGNAAQDIQFKVTGTGSDTTKPTVTAAAPTATNGQFTVSFSEPVKGGSVAGSATDLANYKLDGAALPANATITLNAGKNQATVTLPAGAFATTANHVLSVSNVQDAAGNVIDSAAEVLSITENTAPELQAAVYDATAGNIVLTFTDNVDGKLDGVAVGQTAVNIGDLVVEINGVDVTADVELAASTDEKKVIVQDKAAAPAVSFATGSIVVKTKSTGLTTTDAAGNALKVNTTGVTVNR